MTNVEELKKALKETLEERGVLNQIRAIMRQNIFEAIESDDKPKPKISKENLIINELIKDYLKYNNYLHSNSVFEKETGQQENALDRNFIAKELNILEDNSSKQVPLLYSILFGLQKEVYIPPNEQIKNNQNVNKSSNINPLNIVNNNDERQFKDNEKKPWNLDQ